ncbi:hypothetical protein ACQKM9_17365 [Viridibacillus sp. NPDC093762]|uniref:hypothetical protein n=1 Tax=Viridibacillus sp. NPDC093762 TaxID=3390720 RepID=UPI003CFC6D62
MKKKNIIPMNILKVATCAALISSAALPYYAMDKGIQRVGAETKPLVFNENEWERLGTGTVSVTTSAKLVDFNSEGQICLYHNGDLIKKVDVDFEKNEYMLVGNGGVYIYDDANKTTIMQGGRSDYAYLLEPSRDREYSFCSLITTRPTSWTLYSKAKNIAPTTKIDSKSQTPIKDGKMTLKVNGTVKDENIGDKLTVKYAIDGGSEKVGKTFSADGTEQEYNFNALDNEAIAEGSHTLEVWTEDNKENVSNKESTSFTAKVVPITENRWERVTESERFRIAPDKELSAFYFLSNTNVVNNLYRFYATLPYLNYGYDITVSLEDLKKYQYRFVLYRESSSGDTVFDEYIFNDLNSLPIEGHAKSFPTGTGQLVLERRIKDTAPTTKINSTSQTPLKDGKMTLTVNGTVKDEDVNDELKVKYAIDGGVEKEGKTITADGSEQEYSFNALDNEAIAEGEHTVEVWSEDGIGNKSDSEFTSFVAEPSSSSDGWEQVVKSSNWAGTASSTFSIIKLGIVHRIFGHFNDQVAYTILSTDVPDEDYGKYKYRIMNYVIDLGGNVNLFESAEINQKDINQTYLFKKSNAPGTFFTLERKLKNNTPIIQSKMDKSLLSSIDDFNKLTLSGTVKDEDINDTLKVKYSIDNEEAQVASSTLTADGTEQSFEHELTIDDTYTDGSHSLSIWVEDNKGSKSDKQNYKFKVDNTAPTISVDNIKEGQLYHDEVTPNIVVADNNSNASQIVKSIKLDGKAYDEGTAITSSGTHTLEIEAIDEVGNVGTKTVTFEINQSPTVVKNIDDQSTQKHKEITLDLSGYFEDAENDKLSFNATSDNENAAKATVKDSILTLKGMKQGTANIIVQANDGHSDSRVISFATKVDTRPPAIQFENSKLVLLDETAGFELDGRVEDKDIEDVVVNGNFNNIQKDVTIATTGNKDAWQLHWSASELPVGVYDTLKVTADDGFGGTDSISYPNLIIKVKGTANAYKAVLNQYANDISKDVEDLTVNEHGSLLDAYYAMVVVKDNANSTNLKDAKTKVDLLAGGDLKTSYLNELTTQAWNITSQNLSTVDKEILELAGLTNIQADSLSDYQTKGQQYKNDTMAITIVDSFTKADLQKVIDSVNDLSKALQTKDLADWIVVKESAQNLVIGHYQSELLNTIQANVLSYIEKDTTILTIDVLDKFFALPGETKNEWEYQTYLVDVIKSLKEDLNKSHIVDVVTKVDVINNVLKTGMKEPSKKVISEYLQGVSELVNGNYKDGKESLADSLKLAFLVKYPEQHDKEDFDRLGLVITEDNIPSYYKKLKQYVDLIGAEHFTVKYAQDIITAVDASLEAIKSPTDDNIQSMKDSIDGVKDGDKLFKDFILKLKDVILDIAINNPNELTNDQLKEVFGDLIVDDNLNEYQSNLEQYKKDKGEALIKEDIQLVIESTNAVINAEQEKTLAAVEEAKVIVDKLLKGNLKDTLLDRLDKVVIGIITNDTSNITKDDLEYLGTENVRPELENDYKHALGNANATTKDEIQAVINTVNQLVDTLTDWSTSNLSKLIKLKEVLPNGDFKHEIGEYIEVIEDFRKAMNDFEVSALDKANSTIEMLPIAPYKALLNPSQNALNKLLSAKKDLDKARIDGALTAIEEMANSTVKIEMMTKWKELQLEYFINHLNEADVSDLEDLGIKNLKPEYEQDYLDALKQYAEDKGSALTKEDIQLVIEVVNAVNKAKEKKNNALVKEAQTLIKNMIDGELKTSYTKEMSSLYNVLNPSYPVDKDWLEYVQKNPSIVTESDLSKAGIENIDNSLIDEYRSYLNLYTKDHENEVLTKEDIQFIIDTINALNRISNKTSTSTIQKLQNVISTMIDGTVKEELLLQLATVKAELGFINPTNKIEIKDNKFVDIAVTFTGKQLASNKVDLNISAVPNTDIKKPQLTLYKVIDSKKTKIKTIQLGSMKAGELKEINYSLTLAEGKGYEITATISEGNNTVKAINSIKADDLKKYLFLEKISEK